jgi:hypothetical protein
MTTYRFDEVFRTAKRRVPCTGGCGKKLNRQQTFIQTINPFNKNAQGQPKTSGEIWQELGVECDEWRPVAACHGCRDEVRAREKAVVAQWNAAYGAGTPVRYWVGDREGAGVESATCGGAFVLVFCSAAVFVVGRKQPVALTHVEPVAADAVVSA